MVKKWLITGGCGFIGTSLIKTLIKEGGHAILVVDNLSVGTRDDLARVCKFTELDPTSLCAKHSTISSASQSSALTPQSSSVELVVGDILNEELALKVAKRADVIVHLAANTGVGPSVKNPRKDMEANVIGTFNMLEAARQNNVKRFIFASSGAPIGECKPPIHEELAPHPVSPYGASKLAGEGYCSAYYRAYGIETVALRFGNVYGPLSAGKNSVIAKFIKQILAGETLEIYGDGEQTRDFIYIDDLIQAIRKAVNPPSHNTSHTPLATPWGEAFQIATNAETTIQEMTNKLLFILSDLGYKKIEVKHVETRTGDVRRNFSDTSKAKKILGWEVKTKLDQGLKQTVEWFIEKY